MLPSCRSTTRIASNAIANHPSVPKRTYAAVKYHVQSPRKETGFKDFVQRLSARNKEMEREERHFRTQNGIKSAENTPLRLTVKGLKPFEVVRRINALLDEGRLDHAISMVEKLPLDCVNVVIWNVLIAAAIKAARYKLAFELYYDMKRRHVQPNSRTFTILFVGLSRIDDWTPYANILGRVFNAYDQLLAHFERLK
ncbi:hypothetical protein FRC17_007894, partial [Serendipita sp. 399]